MRGAQAHGWFNCVQPWLLPNDSVSLSTSDASNVVNIMRHRDRSVQLMPFYSLFTNCSQHVITPTLHFLHQKENCMSKIQTYALLPSYTLVYCKYNLSIQKLLQVNFCAYLKVCLTFTICLLYVIYIRYISCYISYVEKFVLGIRECGYTN